MDVIDSFGNKSTVMLKSFGANPKDSHDPHRPQPYVLTVEPGMATETNRRRGVELGDANPVAYHIVTANGWLLQPHMGSPPRRQRERAPPDSSSLRLETLKPGHLRVRASFTVEHYLQARLTTRPLSLVGCAHSARSELHYRRDD